MSNGIEFNIKNLVGFHIGGSPDALLSIPEFYKNEGIRWFQVFASSPMGPALPKIKQEMMDCLRECPDVNIVFHSPYWVSLSNKASRGYNLRYINQLMLQCVRYDIPFNYVTHLGYPSKGAVIQESQEAIKDFIDELLPWWGKGMKGTLWLEADSGHNQNWRGENGLHSLIEVVKEVNDSRIKICADSEHIYASGERAPRGDEWKYIGLIHLNSIPQEVIRGKHLDRHSLTALEDCKIGDAFVSHYFFNGIKHHIPMILERRDLDISLRDIEFLERLDPFEAEMHRYDEMKSEPKEERIIRAV